MRSASVLPVPFKGNNYHGRLHGSDLESVPHGHVQVTFLDGRRVKARQEAPRWIDQYRVSSSAPQQVDRSPGLLAEFPQQEHLS